MKPMRTSITVNPQLWRRFKATLTLENKDMSAVIEAMVKDYLDEHEASAREAANQSHHEKGA
jgi:metal-responsive CopG/Arc/MetJ family transcriptional regulator